MMINSFRGGPLTMTRVQSYLFLQILAVDSVGVDKLMSTLGTGDALKTKLNAELANQSLKESSDVTAPVKSAPGSAGLLSGTWALMLVAPVVAYVLLV
jgi:hypothetical protein